MLYHLITWFRIRLKQSWFWIIQSNRQKTPGAFYAIVRLRRIPRTLMHPQNGDLKYSEAYTCAHRVRRQTNRHTHTHTEGSLQPYTPTLSPKPSFSTFTIIYTHTHRVRSLALTSTDTQRHTRKAHTYVYIHAHTNHIHTLLYIQTHSCAVTLCAERHTHKMSTDTLAHTHTEHAKKLHAKLDESKQKFHGKQTHCSSRIFHYPNTHIETERLSVTTWRPSLRTTLENVNDHTNTETNQWLNHPTTRPTSKYHTSRMLLHTHNHTVVRASVKL